MGKLFSTCTGSSGTTELLEEKEEKQPNESDTKNADTDAIVAKSKELVIPKETMDVWLKLEDIYSRLLPTHFKISSDYAKESMLEIYRLFLACMNPKEIDCDTVFSFWAATYIKQMEQLNDKSVEVSFRECFLSEWYEYKKEQAKKELLEYDKDDVKSDRTFRFTNFTAKSAPTFREKQEMETIIQVKLIDYAKEAMNADLDEELNKVIACLESDKGTRLYAKMISLMRHVDSKELVFYSLIRMYTEESVLYRKLNSDLRAFDAELYKQDKQSLQFDAFGNMLMIGLIQLRNSGLLTNCDKQVYRGMGLPLDVVKQYEKSLGRQVGWSHFISTSKKEEQVKSFFDNSGGDKVNVIFEIRPTKQETQGFLLSNCSAFKHEEEVLFLPWMKLIIDSVKEESPNVWKVVLYGQS